MSLALAQPSPMPARVPSRLPGRPMDALREAVTRCPAASEADIATVLGGREPMGVLRGYAAGSPERPSGATEKQ